MEQEQARHGELQVQAPLQRRQHQTQGRCKPKHSALVPESLTGTQAPLGSHSTLLLFPRINIPSSYCLLLHTLRATRGFCTAPLCGTGIDCALLLEMGVRLVLIHLSVGWILVGISPCLRVFILCGAYTWSAVPLGCPTPHGPLMMLLSDNRSLPFRPNNAPDVPKETPAFTKKSTENSTVAVFPYHRDKLQHRLTNWLFSHGQEFNTDLYLVN